MKTKELMLGIHVEWAESSESITEKIPIEVGLDIGLDHWSQEKRNLECTKQIQNRPRTMVIWEKLIYHVSLQIYSQSPNYGINPHTGGMSAHWLLSPTSGSKVIVMLLRAGTYHSSLLPIVAWLWVRNQKWLLYCWISCHWHPGIAALTYGKQEWAGQIFKMPNLAKLTEIWNQLTEIQKQLAEIQSRVSGIANSQFIFKLCNYPMRPSSQVPGPICSCLCWCSSSVTVSMLLLPFPPLMPKLEINNKYHKYHSTTCSVVIS